MIFDIFKRKKKKNIDSGWKEVEHRPGVVKFDDTNNMIDQIIEVLNRNRITIRKNKIDKIWKKK